MNNSYLDINIQVYTYIDNLKFGVFFQKSCAIYWHLHVTELDSMV
jgi:hypothetical protein